MPDLKIQSTILDGYNQDFNKEKSQVKCKRLSVHKNLPATERTTICSEVINCLGLSTASIIKSNMPFVNAEDPSLHCKEFQLCDIVNLPSIAHNQI